MSGGNFRDRMKSLWDGDGAGGPADQEPGDRVKARGGGDSLRISIGIDFGTTYTKVCYRNLNTEQSGIIDFSETTEHDWSYAMIPSEILIGSDSEILAGLPRELEPVGEYLTANAIKMRLAHLDLQDELEAFEFDPLLDYGDVEGIELLAAIFLGNVLISSRNWLLENRPDIFAGRNVFWSASIGVPVRIFESPAIKRFNRVLGKAWLLARDRSDPIRRIDEAKIALDDAKANEKNAAVDAHAYPEIAAAVLAFVNSPSAKETHYLYFDVGGGTLDSVSFRLLREEGRRRVEFHMGEIQPLGVEAILSRYPELDPDALLHSMQTGETTSEIDAALSTEETEINSQVARIVMGTKRKNPHEWTKAKVNPDWYQKWKSGGGSLGPKTLPLFIGGGGGDFQFYNECIFRTFSSRGLVNCGIPEFVPATVPNPDDLDLGSIPMEQFHRFSVAYGLSIDFGEAPAFKLPNEIPEIELPPLNELSPLGHYED